MRAGLNIGHGSDPGLVRRLNEDYHRVWEYPLRDGHLLLFGVADGMGGAAAGEYASRTAIQVLDECIGRYVADVGAGKAVIGLDRVVERCARLANHRLFRLSEDPQRAGMGSTLTYIALHGQRAYVAHVGDSRAYLVNGEGIRQLTVDHTWVEEQISLGLLDPEHAQEHEWRNLLTRVLGTSAEIEVDVTVVAVEPGDHLIVSTDGLHGLVPDEELLEVTRSARNSQSAVEQLLNLARERGGPDNITLVIVEVP